MSNEIQKKPGELSQGTVVGLFLAILFLVGTPFFFGPSDHNVQNQNVFQGQSGLRPVSSPFDK